MNKKIFSAVMAATMLASSAPTFAQNDVMPISNDIMVISAKVNVFEGVVSGIEEGIINVTIDGIDYGFILAEGVELGDIMVGDNVKLTTGASLKTKDIKEALSIEKVEKSAETDVIKLSYNRYLGKVASVDKGVVNVELDGVTYGFLAPKAIYTINGENTEIKAGDTVVVFSNASLKTKDIKPAEAIVVTNEESIKSAYVDTFKIENDILISADGEYVLNVEDKAKYDGKKLLIFYSMMTASLPAQINPEKIVVLDENEDADEVVENTETVNSYNRYLGKVASVDKGVVNVELDGVTYGFLAPKAIYTINGEKTKEVKAGDMVTVLSNASLKTKDIEPAEVIVVTNEESNTSVYLDTFKFDGESLVSADGELVLNMDNAKKYDNKKLLVFYDFATLSLPAQTNPIKVVEIQSRASICFKVGDSILSINGKDIEVEKPFIAGAGTTLVPLRVISEAFGADVEWNGEDKSVTIKLGDKTIVVKINSKSATVDKDTVIELEEAPQLKNDTTMVPLRFISETLGADVQYDKATQGITVEMK